MQGRDALKSAIELMNMPSMVHMVKSDPLPDGIPLLLRLVVGDEQSMREATSTTERSPKVIKEAAEFFIEQIMLAPDADSYRVLGAGSRATSHELRANMALLIRWLHPDHDPEGVRTVFISRITGAWDNLKTKERRAAYNKKLRIVQRQKAPVRSRKKPGSGQKKQRMEKYRNRKAKSQKRRGASRRDTRLQGHHKKQHLGFFRRMMLLLFNRTIR